MDRFDAGSTRRELNIGGGNERRTSTIVKRICDLVDDIVPKLGGKSRSLSPSWKIVRAMTGATPLRLRKS